MSTCPFLEMQVKALVQPLGSENQWNELGDGRVEYHGYSIRVICYPSPSSISNNNSTTNSSALETSSNAGDKSAVVASSVSPQIILEDTITDETPFVGENSCIVWNSIEQELSLCMMFNTEIDFQIAWSALHALQHKPYPPLGIDLFKGCRREPSDIAAGEDNSKIDSTNSNDSRQDLAPYSDVIHFRYNPPLGMIERHAMAVSLLEHRHLDNPDLFKEEAACVSLLKLGHADLLENLVAPSVYPMFLQGLNSTIVPPKPWSVPTSLEKTLPVAPEFMHAIHTALCLHHLKHEVVPVEIDEEVIAVIDGVNHRLQNEAACSLLADDNLISSAVAALDVIPVVEESSLSRSSTPTELLTAPSVVVEDVKTRELPCFEAETQVADHLRFFTSLISLSIAAFSKELVAPVMGKVFSQGLLEALAKVAERFTVPSSTSVASRRPSPDNQTASPTARSASSQQQTQQPQRPAPPSSKINTSRPSRLSQAKTHYKMYSHRVEDELTRLLDATLVRLNEKQEEVAVNDFFRGPILEHPDRFVGLLSFLIRQTCAVAHNNIITPQGATGPIKKELGVGSNHFLLYHLLGMHDDEGSSSSERALDPENEAKRSDFHQYVVKHFIGAACKGLSASQSCSASPMRADATSGNGTRRSSKESGGSSTPQSPALRNPILTFGVAPPLIRVMEYLLRIASIETQELLMYKILDKSTVIFDYIDHSFRLAKEDQKSVAGDVLCGHLRFLKALVQCACKAQPKVAASTDDEAKGKEAPDGGDANATMRAKESDPMSHLLPSGSEPPKGVSSAVAALAVRTLTIERDVFAPILEAYSKLGGTKKKSLFHCTVRSLLQDLFMPHSSHSENLRTLILLKHRPLLPQVFVQAVEREMLESLLVRLDVSTAAAARVLGGTSPTLMGHHATTVDISTTSSSPSHSPLGRYLSVDELATPPDAKQLEDVAAFPKKLRAAIGRLSPTPRGSAMGEDEGSSPSQSLLNAFPIPKGSLSPNAGTLAPPVQKGQPTELLESGGKDDGSAGSAKPTAPKQAKGEKSSGRTTNRQLLSDGKPLMKSK